MLHPVLHKYPDNFVCEKYKYGVMAKSTALLLLNCAFTGGTRPYKPDVFWTFLHLNSLTVNWKSVVQLHWPLGQQRSDASLSFCIVSSSHTTTPGILLALWGHGWSCRDHVSFSFVPIMLGQPSSKVREHRLDQATIDQSVVAYRDSWHAVCVLVLGK